MGQTPKALRCVIWVDDEFATHPAIQALIAKGHTVQRLGDIAVNGASGGIFDMPHLILSHAAHAWTPEMFEVKGLLDVAMKSTRDRKRGK